jgi:hypothetical protein
MEVSCCGAVIGCIGPLVAIRQGNGRGAVVVEGQVVLLSRDEGLASTIGRLLSDGEGVAQFHSAAELTDWSTPTVATVILDSQPHVRRLSYKHVRERYHGPLIMLLDMDERRPDLPPDGARRYLQRPFEVAELSSLLDTPVPELGPFEAAIIAAWSHRVTIEPPVPVRPRPATQLPSWGPSPWRRARVWAVTIVALVGLLLVVSLSGQGSCASPCTQVGGPVAGAAEDRTPPTSTPATRSAGGGRGDSQPPGSSAVSSQPSTPASATGFPVVTGVGGLIESTNPITGNDTTPTSGPVAVPGVPAPPGVKPPPTTNPPSGTTPPPTTGDRRAAEHHPAAGHHLAADHGPADRRTAHHGAADHRAPDHGPAHDRPTHHGPADHRASHDRADHRAPDHGASHDGAAHQRAPDHGPAHHGARDHRAAHNRGAFGVHGRTATATTASHPHGDRRPRTGPHAIPPARRGRPIWGQTRPGPSSAPSPVAPLTS